MCWRINFRRNVEANDSDGLILIGNERSFQTQTRRQQFPVYTIILFRSSVRSRSWPKGRDIRAIGVTSIFLEGRSFKRRLGHSGIGLAVPRKLAQCSLWGGCQEFDE